MNLERIRERQATLQAEYSPDSGLTYTEFMFSKLVDAEEKQHVLHRFLEGALGNSSRVDMAKQLWRLMGFGEAELQTIMDEIRRNKQL